MIQQITIDNKQYNLDTDAALKSGVLKRDIKSRVLKRPIKFADLKNGDIFYFRFNEPDAKWQPDLYLMIDNKSTVSGQCIHLNSNPLTTFKTFISTYNDIEFAVLVVPDGTFKTEIKD